VIVFFFISARYRVNILPFLIILAVYGVIVLFKLFQEKAFTRAASACGLLLILLIACNWKVGKMSTDFNADAYFNLGVNYMEQKRPEAKTMFEKAVAQDPGYPDANGNLGIIRDMEGDHLGAVECFKKVLARYPEDVDANSQLGISYYHLGDIKKAREQFVKVLTLDKENEIAKYNLAILNKKVRENRISELDRLIDKYLAQLREDPKNPALLSNLGMAYIMVKQYDNALKFLREAVALAPHLPRPHNNLGVVLLERGEIEEARKEFETALRLDPNYESPRKNLQRLKKLQKAK